MGLSSQTYDAHGSGPSSRTSISGVLHKSSKETIQSYQESISNSSVHTSASKATIPKELFGLSEQGHFPVVSLHSSDLSIVPDPSVSDHKSLYSLEKPTFRFRNQSLSTVCTISEPESDRSSTATSSARQSFRSLSVSSLEDEAEPSLFSTPCSSRAITPTLITYPSPSQSPGYTDPPSPPSGDGDSQPLATMEISTVVTPTIQEYQEPLSNVNIYAGATADYEGLFVPSSQAPSPPGLHNASKPSTSRDRDSSYSVSHHNSRNSLHKSPPPPLSRGRSVSTAPTTIHEAESDPSTTPPSTQQHEFSSFTLPFTEELAPSSVPPTPPRHSRDNTADLHHDLNSTPVRSAAPTALLDGLPGEPYDDHQSFVTAVASSSAPPDRMGTVSRSRGDTVTAKGKKGMLGFMTDRLNSNKRPKISTPIDPIHLTHVGFNSSTGEFSGLPKEWQQLLQDSGISKSDQEKNPLAVMEIVKFYQEGGGDVWDKMGHAPAPGSSQSPPIPGTLQAAFPGLSKSVDDSFIPTVSGFPRSLQPPSDNSKRPALSTTKKAQSSGGPQVVSSSHLPASYRPLPTPPRPAQPNLDLLNPQQSVAKPPHSDTLVSTNTTNDRRSPGPRASVKASARESSNSSAADLAIKSQATVAVNGPVAERRAPQPPTAPQQQSAAVASLAKAADATLWRYEKKKEDKANDADMVKRLQQICTDADPTRLYRNLVKIGQG
jgi:p21-activated kinase 1